MIRIPKALSRFFASAYIAFVLLAWASDDLRAMYALLPLAAALHWAFSRLDRGAANAAPAESAQVAPAGVGGRRTALAVALPLFAAIAAVHIAVAWRTGALFEMFEISDARNQWRMLERGFVTDWHPFLHTCLFVGIPRALFGSWCAVAVFHLLLLAASFAFMAYALIRSGCGRVTAVVAVLFSAVSPMGLYFASLVCGIPKDVAFAALCIVSSAMAVRSLAGDGAWLRRRANAAAFGIALALVTILRHNGLFFTVPMLSALLAFRCSRRGAIRVAALCAVAVFAVKCPLKFAFGVKPYGDPHKHLLVESCGLPFTMMGCVYHVDGDATPTATRKFLETFVAREHWLGAEWLGHYNSVKPDYDLGNPAPPWGDFFRAFGAAVSFDPQTAWKGALDVTQVAWKPVPGATFAPVSRSAALHERLSRMRFGTIPAAAFATVMNHMSGIALLAFAAALALRPGRRDVALLSAPPLVYGVLTALMLTGPESRFFYPGFAVCAPSFAFLLTRTRRAEPAR